MSVYLDNNIFVSIEERGLDFNIIQKHLPKEIQFVYSTFHIQELLEYKTDLKKLKERRFKTILETTNYNYIIPNGDSTEIIQYHPENVIKTIKKFQIIFDSFRKCASNFSIDRDKFMLVLGIDKNSINNYNSQNVIDHINSLLKKKEEDEEFDFEMIINLAGTNLHEKINSIFNFMDIVGYWKDKQTEKSDLARMYDAGHTYYASGCDFFISDDRRARNKAKVAYEFCNIKTKVLSLEELFLLPVLN